MTTDGLVVLGGGLAGLSASLHSGAPCYEASARPGGAGASDTTEGFTFDRGIHILQTQSTEVLELLASLGIEMLEHERRAFIYSHGTYTAYPFQVNTAGLPLGVRARCVWDFLRRDVHPEPEDYEGWIYKNLGRGFGDVFLIPYSVKFWGVHPRELTHTWMGNRVPRPELLQVLRGALWSKQTAIGTNATFRYPANPGGYGAVAQAFADRVDVRPDHRAVRLDTKRRRVEFENGGSADYEVLVSTIPLPELVRIAVDAPAEVREAAGRLRTNSIFVVNLGIGRPELSDSHWMHFPEADVAFFRLSYPHNFSPAVAPPGTSSISAEVAYSEAAPVDRAGIVDRVVDDLIRVGALGADDPIVATATHDVRWGYCLYDHARARALDTIHGWLKSADVIPAGRYGLWTYFWSDQAILSGKKAAGKAVDRLGNRQNLAGSSPAATKRHLVESEDRKETAA